MNGSNPIGTQAGTQHGVSRELVHRAAISEVFLLDSVAERAGHYECPTQLPRTNIYFNDFDCADRHYDMLLLIEAFRQASIYLSHAYFGAPIGAKFLYDGSSTKVLDISALRVGNAPLTALIEVTLVDEATRRGARFGVTLDMNLSVGGRIVARHAGMASRWMDGDVWRRMREKSISQHMATDAEKAMAVKPLPPEAVGRQSLINVVIGNFSAGVDGSYSADLIVPLSNPAIFDHPLDHVPGMLILECFRQTAIAAISKRCAVHPGHVRQTECCVTFSRFAEFAGRSICLIAGHELEVSLSSGLARCSNIVLVQNGHTVASANLAFDIADAKEARECDAHSVTEIAA